MKQDLILREENIASIIYMIRGEKVMLDMDLAELYDVETKILKQTVRRNMQRFPDDFMFELTRQEFDNLKMQFVSSSWGGLRYTPFAFTEQGVAMLSGILNSERAIAVNIAIMRTFVQMRKFMLANIDLSKRINELERLMINRFEDNEADIRDIYEALRQLTIEEEVVTEPRRPIGFK
jgi:ORF6N domain